MSIFDLEVTMKQKIIPKRLKEHGFERIGWGVPRHKLKSGNHGWDRDQYCYCAVFSYCDPDVALYGTRWWGTVTYFPEGFTGYVPAFHGTPEPGTILITSINGGDIDEKIAGVKTVMGLEAVIDDLARKYPEFKMDRPLPELMTNKIQVNYGNI